MRLYRSTMYRPLFSLCCLVALFLLSLLTIIKPSMRPALANQQVFVCGVEGVQDLTTLDPALVSDEVSVNAIDMIFTGLVQLDDQLRIRPQLAQSYEALPDGRTYIFHLRPHLMFSDGTPLTAQDVIYSIDRALQPRLASHVALTYLLIKDADKLAAGKIKTLIGDSLNAPDDETVVITTAKRGNYFLDALTYPTSYVVERRLIEKYGESGFTSHLMEGGGAGPFRVQTYTHNKQIVFVPDPFYYGARPSLQKVIMPFYPTVDAGYAAYLAGQVDNTAIPASDTLSAELYLSEFHEVNILALRYYAMNYLEKPFDNIHIRQAFALALNKNVLVNAALDGIDLPTNHIVPQGMPAYNPALTGPDGTSKTSDDPAEARALLQQGMREEGWTGLLQIPPIKFTYNVGGSTTESEVAMAIRMWRTVLGIPVQPDPITLAQMFSKLTATVHNRAGLQLWRFTWIADYPDPQDWLTLQFDRNAQYNNVNYGQNTADDSSQQQATQMLLEQADTNLDADARLRQYAQAEQQLVRDVAWLPVYQLRARYLLKPYVRGIVDNALTIIPPDDWSKVSIAAH